MLKNDIDVLIENETKYTTLSVRIPNYIYDFLAFEAKRMNTNISVISRAIFKWYINEKTK